jgi:hypothetical protein
LVEDNEQTLLLIHINVIINDALVKGSEVGVQFSFDTNEPLNPVETRLVIFVMEMVLPLVPFLLSIKSSSGTS